MRKSRGAWLGLVVALVILVQASAPAVALGYAPDEQEVSGAVVDSAAVVDAAGEEPPLSDMSLGYYHTYLPLVVRNFGAASGTISPGAGGTVSTADGQVTVTAPPGAVNTTVTLTIERSESSPPAQVSDAGMVFDIHAYDAAGNPVTSFGQPLLVTLSYAGLDDFSLSVANLAIYHHEADGSWRKLETTVDAGARVARAYTTQLSAFGLFAPSGIVTEDPGSLPETPAPLSMVFDASGNLYWLDFNSWYIQKLAPGATVAEPYHHYPTGRGEYPDDLDLDIDRSTGTLYFSTGLVVSKLTSSREQSVLYDALESSYYIGNPKAVFFDQANDVLYVAGEYTVAQIDPQTGDLIKKLATLRLSSSSKIQDILVDPQGRVFAIVTDFGPAGSSFANFWGTLYSLENVDAYSWDLVASGLAHPERLAMDSQGTLYVSNPGGDAITVVSGDDPAVTGFIRAGEIQWGVAVRNDTLWTGGEGGLFSFPRSRRDKPAGTLSATIAPAATVSGQGSLLTISANMLEMVPAHNVLRIGGTPVRNLVGLSENTLTYELPNIYPDPGGWSPKVEPSSGACILGEGAATASCGTFSMPEWGNWQSAHWYESGDTIQLAQHEWLVWSQFLCSATSVVSHQGLFEAWDTTKGPWLAYQFNQPGTYSFTMTVGGADVLLNVEVTRLGGGHSGRFKVDPTVGGTLYNSGCQLHIPAGALPGTDPYTVTVSALSDTPDLQYSEAYPERSKEYQVTYDPEPTHLNAAITFRMPYDAAAVSETPGGAFYDATLRDYTALDSEARDGYVTVTFPAGDYGDARASGQAADLRAQDADLVVGKSGIWSSVTEGLNLVGQSLWWASGLPDAKTVDTNFGIIYHTADGVSEAYAQSLLNALNNARNLYISMGYDVPDNQVLVKVSPWATKLSESDGFVPRVSMLGTWTIVLNDKLDANGIKTTTAHEFFHVTQRVTMRMDASAPRWWMEGTATWAEYLIDHSAESYKNRIYYGSNFLNVSYLAWDGALDVHQEYATVAFVLYLQECGEDVILNIFKRLSSTINIYHAIRLTLGMDCEEFGTFYGEFARDYWQKNYSTAADWDLSLAFEKVRLTSAKNTILDDYICSLSSGVINAYYNPVDRNLVPDSFSEASGSVLRAPETWPYTQVYMLDKDEQATENNFLGEVDPTAGFALDKLGDYEVHGPYFVYVNANPDVQLMTSHMQLVLETPTITWIDYDGLVFPDSPKTVTIHGGGFGPDTGSVTVTHGDAEVISWNEDNVVAIVEPSSSSNMSLRVVHAKGVSSNPESIPVE